MDQNNIIPRFSGNINVQIDDYILNHIDEEGELLASLNRDAHVNLLRPRMLSGHLQGRFLKMMARIHRPKKVLEIGTYTGYATLCLAEGLPDDGVIHTIEIDDELEDFIRKQFDKSSFKDKIHLHTGDALDIIPTLNESFDMVFLDADKRLYSQYYDLIFDKVNLNGVILADNTLWDGKVLNEPHPNDKQTIGILEFNKKIKQDTRIEKVILPLRDGLTIIYKIKNG
ncbi:MAG: O-methyltransferase [Dysgonamonadaceae bacterium]|jgi:predicted O-methyltransferase YrrM|nr:O-methyltransferase [Dysgonamonadaceae bacterium]